MQPQSDGEAIGQGNNLTYVQIRFGQLDILKCNRFPGKNRSVIPSILHVSRRSSNNLIHRACNSVRSQCRVAGSLPEGKQTHFSEETMSCSKFGPN